MGSRENFIGGTHLFQMHYCINTNYESKYAIERWTRKKKNKVFAILNKGVD